MRRRHRYDIGDRLAHIHIGDSDTQTCHGDSGGPAFQTINGREVIVGITSFGTDTRAEVCINGGFDTRVDSVLSFIDSEVPPPALGPARDILWRGSNGQVSIWFMNVDGTIARQVFPGDPPPGLDWSIDGNGDFNHDGTSDILWRGSNGQVSIWFMNADGTIAQQVFPGAPGLDWSIQRTGDFNHDDTSDILFRNVNSGQVAIWFMNTDGTIARQVFPGAPGLDWSIQGAGDFNRDGTDDILFRNVNSGQVAIWFMNTDGTIARQVFPGAPGPDWSIQGVGDFNVDGTSDVLFRNVNGQVALWLMNVDGTIARQVFPGLPGNDWTIEGVGDFH